MTRGDCWLQANRETIGSVFRTRDRDRRFKDLLAEHGDPPGLLAPWPPIVRNGRIVGGIWWPE